MLLHLVHRTTFVYAGPVHDSFNEVRLRPVDDDRQACKRFDLRIDPPGSQVNHYLDYYGNRVYYFDVAARHQKLVIESDAEVETVPTGLYAPVPVVRTDVASGGPPLVELYAEYLAESHYVPQAVEIWREMQDVFAIVPRCDVWTDAKNLSRHVYTTFKYQPNSTGVNTLATDALAQRMGVCQDFAHLTLGLCRQAGIPARYVSGYFFNAKHKPDEVEASHAWIEVLVPGFGWVGYDPTHDRVADERYVKIAAGRDYADIRPVSGTYRGAQTKELRVEVYIRQSTPAAA